MNLEETYSKQPQKFEELCSTLHKAQVTLLHNAKNDALKFDASFDATEFRWNTHLGTFIWNAKTKKLKGPKCKSYKQILSIFQEWDTTL